MQLVEAALDFGLLDAGEERQRLDQVLADVLERADLCGLAIYAESPRHLWVRGRKTPSDRRNGPHNHSSSRKRSSLSVGRNRRRFALVSCSAFNALSFISMSEVM